MRCTHCDVLGQRLNDRHQEVETLTSDLAYTKGEVEKLREYLANESGDRVEAQERLAVAEKLLDEAYHVLGQIPPSTSRQMEGLMIHMMVKLSDFSFHSPRTPDKTCENCGNPKAKAPVVCTESDCAEGSHWMPIHETITNGKQNTDFTKAPDKTCGECTVKDCVTRGALGEDFHGCHRFTPKPTGEDKEKE